MSVSVQCPHCQTTYRVSKELVGRGGKCKKCGQTFTLETSRAHVQEGPSTSDSPKPAEPSPSPPGPTRQSQLATVVAWAKQNRRIVVIASAALAAIVCCALLLVRPTRQAETIPMAREPAPTDLTIAAAETNALQMAEANDSVRQSPSNSHESSPAQAETQLRKSQYAATLRQVDRAWEQGDIQGALEFLAACDPKDAKWEHAYLEARCKAAMRSLPHSGTIRSLQFSDDGKWLVSAGELNAEGDSGECVLWEVTSAHEILAVEVPAAPLMAVGFAPNPDALIMASQEGAIRLWNVKSNAEIAAAAIQLPDQRIGVATFSRQGHYLAVGIDDEDTSGVIHVWDLRQSQEARKFPAHEYGVRAIAFSPDGTLLASGGRGDETVRVWDLRKGQQIHRFGGHAEGVSAVAFSSDGKRLACGTGEEEAETAGEVKVWDLVTGQSILSLPTDGGCVVAVAFANEDERLIYATERNDVFFWDRLSGRRILLCDHLGPITGIAVSPQGDHVALASDSIRVSEVDQSQRIIPAEITLVSTDQLLGKRALHEEKKRVIALAIDGAGDLAAVSTGDRAIRIWDIQKRQTLDQIDEFASAIALSRDGKWLAVGGADGNIKLRSHTPGSPWHALPKHTGMVSDIAFSDDGQFLASGGADHLIKVSKVADQIEVFVGADHANVINRVAFPPNGSLIASASDDGTVKLWQLGSDKPVATLKGHVQSVTSIAFSRDGTLLASGDQGGMVRIWSVGERTELRALGEHKTSVFGLLFTPDGSRILACDSSGEIRFWDVETGQQLYSLPGGCSCFSRLIADEELRVIGFGGTDGVVRLWHLPSGTTPWLVPPSEPVQSLAGEPSSPPPSAVPIILSAPPLAVSPLNESQAKKLQSQWAEFLNVPLTFSNSVGIRFILIPPGEFVMGSPPDETDLNTDEFQHVVRITRPFYLSVYEVTQEQFVTVTGKNPSPFRKEGRWKDKVAGLETDPFPVDSVAWDEAQAFAAELSRTAIETDEGRSYRLPTEAEWEYSCRAGTRSAYHVGTALSASHANFAHTKALKRPVAVGSYPANAFGLHDMHGNVSEWCSDWYHYHYYKDSLRNDPQGVSEEESAKHRREWLGRGNGAAKVHRGGDFSDTPEFCRSAARDHWFSSHVGIRLVCEIPSAPQSILVAKDAKSPVLADQQARYDTEKHLGYRELDLIRIGAQQVRVGMTRQEVFSKMGSSASLSELSKIATSGRGILDYATVRRAEDLMRPMGKSDAYPLADKQILLIDYGRGSKVERLFLLVPQDRSDNKVSK